jgi:hypothetical protein
MVLAAYVFKTTVSQYYSFKKQQHPNGALVTCQSEEIDHNKIPTNAWVVSKNFFHRRQAFFPVLHLNGLFPH